MRKIDKIIIHCAATPEGKHFTVEQIRQWHVKGNGWSDIGYHFVIYLDGSVHRGRPIEKVGAHTKGYNANSIGICYVGGLDANGQFPEDTRTPAQKKALSQLLANLHQRFPKALIVGHCDLDPMKPNCPGFDVVKEYQDLEA